MANFIIGLLLLTIISSAVGLMIFFNHTINKKTEVDANWRQLYDYLIMKNHLMESLIEIICAKTSCNQNLINQFQKKKYAFNDALIVKEVLASSRELEDLLAYFFKISEEVLEIKENASFVYVCHQLKSLEKKIGKQYALYEDSIFAYNSYLLKFPNNVAGLFLGVEKLYQPAKQGKVPELQKENN